MSQLAFTGMLAQSVPIVTVCEALEGWERYNGKSIIVVGRVVPTMEGAWQSEDCKRKIFVGRVELEKLISLTYAAGEVAPAPACPKDISWTDDRLDKKLKEVQASTTLHATPEPLKSKAGEYDERWMAIFGRFESGAPLLGHFGHLSGAPAQLISGKNCYREWRNK